ncbi:MAG TPA: HAD family hydrolase [Rugosimonospora sp.]|nr:HAD family hydrolase [Rugosimonospora sp.]
MIRPGLPKLVATDLDGTVVRSDDTVGEYTHTVLERVRATGIPVVGVTGRGPRLQALTRRDIPEADYLVLAQGGTVVNLTDPAHPARMRAATVPGSVVEGVLEALEAVSGPLSVLVEALDAPEAPLWGEPNAAWRYPDAIERRTRADALAGPVLKVFAYSPVHSADELLAIARELVPEDGVTVTQAGLGYIEICPPGVTKATGLAVVAASLGLDPGEVLVFGDMPNDLPMFAWAGFGRVAVANAHAEVLAAADEITLSNDEEGVAVYLDRLLSSS